MQQNGCLDGCSEDSMNLFRSKYNAGVTGERKSSGRESSLPPLPEPVSIIAGTSQKRGVPPFQTIFLCRR